MFNDHENTESFCIRNYYFKKMCYFRAHWPLSRWSGRVYLKWNPFPCLQSSYCWEAVELPSKSDLAPAPGVEKRLACWILGPEERLLAPSPGPGLQTYRFREGFSFRALTNPLNHAQTMLFAHWSSFSWCWPLGSQCWERSSVSLKPDLR